MLFGLGVRALAMFGESILNIAHELRALVLACIGVGLAWAVDFNLWSLWHFQARAGWLGVTLTGLLLCGAAYFWTVILGFFSGLLGKLHDEATTLERPNRSRVSQPSASLDWCPAEPSPRREEYICWRQQRRQP
jgi:hypothetical protein